MSTRGIIILGVGAVAGYLIYDKFIKKNGGETTESFASRSPRRVHTSKSAGLKYCKCTKENHGCNTRVLTNEPCNDACTEYCKKKPKKGWIPN